MKALSLRQPWASAVALDSKRIETRSWQTSYRGPLAIHASKRRLTNDQIANFFWETSWRGALHSAIELYEDMNLFDKLPYGCIVAISNLFDIVPTESDLPHLNLYRENQDIHERKRHLFRWTEKDMGDFSVGRFAWLLSDIQILREPIPYVGKRRLFDIPDEIVSIR
jgi:hypothetical protein